MIHVICGDKKSVRGFFEFYYRKKVHYMTLYHGSNVVVTEPQILGNGFYKDFGYGFYCTIYEKQAKRWAITKRKHHIVNKYEYKLDPDLNTKVYKDMTEEWLQL